MELQILVAVVVVVRLLQPPRLDLLKAQVAPEL
jgi:hypothetical protein